MKRGELKPCVCGSKKRRMIHGLSTVNTDIYYVRCPDCGRSTVPCNLRDGAVVKWNNWTEKK